MRRINLKKISLLMIMLVAFSVFIMPAKVEAKVGDTWQIYRGVFRINQGYKDIPTSDGTNLGTWNTYLIRSSSDENAKFFCAEKEKSSPPGTNLGYTEYASSDSKVSGLFTKEKEDAINKVLANGYPLRSFQDFKNSIEPGYIWDTGGPSTMFGYIPISEVEYEKATQFAIWAVMDFGNLDNAIAQMGTSSPRWYRIMLEHNQGDIPVKLNNRIIRLSYKILTDAKKADSNISITVTPEKGVLKESTSNYKIFGPYTIKNTSSSATKIDLSVDKSNEDYTFKILQNDYKVGTAEETDISKSLGGNASCNFYIKVYPKNGVNINYAGSAKNVVTIKAAGGTKGAYFTVMEANSGYKSYSPVEGAIYVKKDGTEYSESKAGIADVPQSLMQHLIYPHEVKNEFTKTISLSWEKSVGNITIYKKDDASKDLAGATFTINTTTGVNWKDVVASGKFIGIKAGTTPTYSEDGKTITFVADSKIEIKDVPFGTYSVLEVESPAGYYTEIKSSDKVITLSATAPNVERTFTNYKVVVDLSLEKWVNKVTGEAKSGKEIITKYNDRNTLDNNVEGRKGDIFVCEGDTVTYTIRIFNHGNVDATATKIIDRVPEGLEFLPNNETNKKYGWKKAEDGSLYTNYLASQELIQEHSKEGTAHNGLNYNSDNNKNIAPSCNECKYKDIQISFRASFKTKDGSTLKRLINVAEIAEYKSEYEDRWTVRPLDVDSKENNHPKKYDFEKGGSRVKYDMAQASTELGKYYREDDEDIAVIIPARFDLSLEKWVNTVIREGEENRKYEDRNTLDNNVEERAGDIKVRKGDTVIYTIRVYNQGNIAGYATEVMDSMPEGLEFLADNEINKQFGWEEREGKLYTTYLSDKKLEAHDGWAEHVGYNYNKGENEEKSCDKCAYKDIQVAFKVGDTVTENKQNIDRIINLAQITKHKTVIDTEDCKYADIDSTPGNYETDFEEGKTREDDEDIAVIVPEKYDLALQKWITSYTKTVGDQEETITTEQNHETTVEEKNNDKLVKIDLAEKDLSKTTIKIKYAIRVENEGEIPGYAKELTDYIPVGTEFHQEDNLNAEGKPYWTMDGDKAVTAEAYEEQLNTILQPGDSHLFYITLRWTNDKNNLGLKNNWVEISKDGNDWTVPDVDSDPENMLEERTPHYWEDEEDEVPFLLTVKTGESMIKYALIFIILLAALGGALLIRRKVKNMI